MSGSSSTIRNWKVWLIPCNIGTTFQGSLEQSINVPKNNIVDIQNEESAWGKMELLVNNANFNRISFCDLLGSIFITKKTRRSYFANIVQKTQIRCEKITRCTLFSHHALTQSGYVVFSFTKPIIPQNLVKSKRVSIPWHGSQNRGRDSGKIMNLISLSKSTLRSQSLPDWANFG